MNTVRCRHTAVSFRLFSHIYVCVLHMFYKQFDYCITTVHQTFNLLGIKRHYTSIFEAQNFIRSGLGRETGLFRIVKE